METIGGESGFVADCRKGKTPDLQWKNYKKRRKKQNGKLKKEQNKMNDEITF